MIKKYFAMTVIAASLAVAGCSDDDDDDEDGDGNVMPPVTETFTPVEPTNAGSPYATIFNSENHQELEELLVAAGLNGALDVADADSAVTVFAPDDTAIGALTAETLAALTANDNAELKRVLLHHVTAGSTGSEALTNAISSAGDGGLAVDTLLVDTGEDGDLPAQQLTFVINSAGGIDITDGSGATNALTGPLDLGAAAEGEPDLGLVHSISSVLLPAAAPETTEPPVTEPEQPPVTGGDAGPVEAALSATSSDFLTAFSASFGAQKLDLATDGDPWTIFAPTNAVTGGAVSAAVVQNHIITGSKLTPQELIDAGTLNTFGGATATFGGTADALTINGEPASVVGDGTGASITYTINTLID